MNSLYVVIVAIIMSLVVIFFGTTYYETIASTAEGAKNYEIFYYWLLFLSIFTIVIFASTIVFYINIREKQGPRGPEGEQGNTGFIYVPSTK
jgi:heme/copper-type cytochrome/quinol oxidase subunit 2